MYKVEYTIKALKELSKLDKYTKKLIIAWIEKNLVDCSDPRAHGKSLSGNRNDQWRYRVGDYRIIAEILEEKVIIHVLSVGHRKNIYIDVR